MDSQKIKLIVFHPYSSIGGADLSISNLINNLNHLKYSIDFICLKRSKNTKKLYKKIKIHQIKSKKTIFAIFKIRKILKKILDQKYKKVIFFSNQNFANLISYLITFGFNKKIKTIIIERNHISELNYHFGIKDKIKKYLIKFLMKFIYKKFDLIICNSKESSKDLKKYLNTPVKTIYNPVNIKNNLKSRKFKKSSLKILNVGRLEKQKDQKTLLKAVKILKKKININLTILGYGNELSNLSNLIKKYSISKNVKIITNIYNPKKFYLNNDLLVSCSLYEGFPNVFVESIMYNLPIISSNCKSGPREILTSNTGSHIFKIKNSLDLSYKIHQFYLNKKILLNRNKLYFKNLINFNKDNIVKKYNNIFEKI